MRRTFFTAIVQVTACAAARAVPVGTINIEHTGYSANGQLRVWGGSLYGSYVRGGVYMLEQNRWLRRRHPLG